MLEAQKYGAPMHGETTQEMLTKNVAVMNPNEFVQAEHHQMARNDSAAYQSNLIKQHQANC